MTIHSSGSVWKPFVRSAAVEVDARFPRNAWTSTYGGHGEIYPGISGQSNVGQYAVDFMIESKAQGDEIAAYLWANRKRLGIRYVIWYRRIISETNLPSTWRTYTNPDPSKRGTASGDHTNHVHASFFSNGKFVPLPGSAAPVAWDGQSFPGAEAFYVGAHGDYITLLGQRLVAHGWTGYLDGPGPDFSATDQKAVAWFQALQGWTGSDADGIPGPTTWALLLAEPAPIPAPVPAPAPEPAPQEPALTKIRVATFNVLSDAAGKKGGEGSFASRLDRIVATIKASKASILLLQECNADRAADVQGRLGADWIWSRADARVVMVDKTVWEMGEERVREMPTPHSKTDKSWPLVELKHIASGDTIWAASVHFSATSPYAKIATTAQMSAERKAQAEEIVDDLKPYSFVVGGGDHNSSSLAVGKPKAVLKAAGFSLLTLDGDFDSKTVDSFPNSTAGGQQIDEIWCKSGLTITDGAIVKSSGGSDHNLMWAELTIAKRT